MTAPRIAFIGGGNMARSLIGGLLRTGTSPSDIVAADPDEGQRSTLAGLGVAATASNAEAIRGARVVVLAVKPQVLPEAVRSMRFGDGQLVVSIAAGVPLAAIARWCGRSLPLVRCMPNTPALYGAAITVLCANEHTEPHDRELATSVLRAAGTTLWVEDEALLDAVTAVSGSGPAYFFYLMEAMIDAGTTLGLDAATARTLTFETARGAAIMASQSEDALHELRRNVTSPGGTTERAIAVLDAARVQAAMRRAVVAAAERSRELASDLEGPSDKEGS